jgi:hypothetical protein
MRRRRRVSIAQIGFDVIVSACSKELASGGCNVTFDRNAVGTSTHVILPNNGPDLVGSNCLSSRHINGDGA